MKIDEIAENRQSRGHHAKQRNATLKKVENKGMHELSAEFERNRSAEDRSIFLNVDIADQKGSKTKVTDI